MEPFLAFSYSSSLTIQVENTRDGKAKIQTTRWCVWNVFILLKSKNYMFIYVRIPKKKKIFNRYSKYNHSETSANIFAKFAITRCFSCRSTFEPYPNNVNNIPIYAREEILVRRKFHKFLELLINVCFFAT